MNDNRRSFLRTSAATTAATALVALPRLARAQNANEKINVAVVGLSGRGRRSHCVALREIAKHNVEIAALSRSWSNT